MTGLKTWGWSALVLGAMGCQSPISDTPLPNDRIALQEVVRLVRDAKGIPHIYANTDAGAAYGAGYAAAEDRLFQMHLARMKYQGRLSELFGAQVTYSDGSKTSIIDMDRKYRTYGVKLHMQRVLAGLDADTVKMLEAYSAGVNASIADQGALPAVFAELGLNRIEPWVPVDSLLAYLITAAAFSKDALSEVKNQKQFDRNVRDQCGGAPSDDCVKSMRNQWLYSIVDDDAAVIPQPETSAKQSPGLSRVPANTKASHAWAIGGAHTTTGKPYLNGRPMVMVRDRAFYQSHIKGKTFDVQGIGVAGMFGYMIGMTAHTAWSLTAMNADTADLFQLTPGTAPNTYVIDGVEYPLDVRTETILVKDAPPETLTIRSGRFGVIVNDLLDPGDVLPNTLYAQRYIVTEQPGGRLHPVQALLGMMRADHWESFRDDGMDYWSYPNANLVYADDGLRGPNPRDEGNICYRPATILPIRASDASMYGLLPQEVDQWTDNWTGYLGVETIPEVCNPETGWIVSANHLPIGSWWGHYGIGGTGETFRSWHIKDALQEQLDSGAITPDQNEAFHRDSEQILTDSLLDMAHWFEDEGRYMFSNESKLAMKVLEQWNGEWRLDVPEFRLVSWESGGSNPMFANFGPLLGDEYGKRASSIVLFFKRFNEDPKSAFEFINDAGERVNLQGAAFAYVNATLEDFWEEATQSAKPAACKRDPSSCLLPHTTESTITYGTFLGTFKEWPLGSHYDLNVDHHGATHLQTVWSAQGNTYSQAVQLGQPDATQTLVAPGNANNPDSPYFDNTMEDWVDGTHYPTPMSQARVEANALEIRKLVYRR